MVWNVNGKIAINLMGSAPKKKTVGINNSGTTFQVNTLASFYKGAKLLVYHGLLKFQRQRERSREARMNTAVLCHKNGDVEVTILCLVLDGGGGFFFKVDITLL